MKKFFLLAPTAFLAIALGTHTLAFAQQKPPRQVGSVSSGKSVTSSNASARRGRTTTASVIPAIRADFDEALKIIENNYVDGFKVDQNSLFKSSIIGMLRSLDPHSNFYDAAEYEELKTDQRSEYYGIGASIQNYVMSDETDTFITATFENTPASRAGLRFGDRIIAVDGTRTVGKSSVEVRDRIRGPRGSTVRITVERASDRKVGMVELVRDSVPQPSVPDAYFIKPGVGYVDMTRGFNYETGDELRSALHHLRANGASSLVLDLRNNPGGFLDQAIQVAQVFLPYGQLILTQKGRNGFRDNTYRSANRSAETIPLVILINDSTASASEIVAGAMQDHDRALIVGETSFGKGLVQSIIPLEYGTGLTLTSAKYYTPSGRLIQRDYSDRGLYDYYTQGGSIALDPQPEPARPAGPEKKTDTGRSVYGGGGITPDEKVNSRNITLGQRRLLSPLFGFTRELVNGRIAGFPGYRVRGGINFDRELQPGEFSVSDSLVKAFREYVTAQPKYQSLAPLVDHHRSFVQLQLRYNIVTAAYGRVMADRVFVFTQDPQVAKAVDLVPRARDLAMNSNRRVGQP